MESRDNIESELENSQSSESQSQIRKEKFQIVNQVGIIYAIGIAIITQIDQIFSLLASHFFENFIKKYRENAILLGTLLVNQIIGTILMFVLTKFIKKTSIAKQKYGYKKYLVNLCINSALLIFGSLIGYFAESFIINNFKQNNENNPSQKLISETLSNSNIFLNFFVICFTAPVAEEFIFRKFLIDRLAIYSKTLAIFSSGILFGIFHINIHQFFGTMLLGWSLAFSYAETGNIIIPISYHMIENTITTITQINNPYKNDKKENKTGKKIIVVIGFMRLIEGLIGIIFFLIYRKKIKVRGEENKSKDKWKFFKSYGMCIFVFEGFILFSLFYLNIFF